MELSIIPTVLHLHSTGILPGLNHSAPLKPRLLPEINMGRLFIKNYVITIIAIQFEYKEYMFSELYTMAFV